MPVSNPISVFPNDLNPNIAIGVNIPFNAPSVFQSNYQTKDAIKNNLINFFLTEPGERYMNPLFGGGLKQYIFNQIESQNTTFLIQDIQDKLNKHFNRLNILSLDINELPDYNTLEIILKYSIKNTNINDTLVLNFNQ
jgi:uncharacterized protein